MAGKSLYQIAVAGGYAGTEREYWLSFRQYVPSSVETDPIFTNWLVTTPPLYSETDPVFLAWLLATPPVFGAAGNDKTIQVNKTGDFEGYDDFTYDDSTKIIGLNGAEIQRVPAGKVLKISNTVDTPAGAGGAFESVNTGAITVPNASTVPIMGSEISLEMWIYVHSGWGRFMGKLYSFYLTYFGALTFDLYGITSLSYSYAALGTDQWNHVVCTYDGAYMKIYIGGVEVASKAATGALYDSGSHNLNLSEPVWADFQGKLDEMRIYSRCLTPTEISEHYNGGAGLYGVPETGLEMGWHFDETSGTVVEDYSGNGADGNLTGVFNLVAGHVGLPATPSLTETISHKNSTRENSKGDINIGADANTYVGVEEPKSKLHVDGAVQVGDDIDTASVDKIGAIRYRVTSNDSYCEMCMQTGAVTYAWVEIKHNTW